MMPALLTLLLGAPPPLYGGDVQVYLPPLELSELPWPLLGPVSGLPAAARYETLFVRSPDGSLEPGLVSAQLGPKGILQLRLRPDIRRHDGASLRAPDIVAWLLELARPGSPHGHLVLDLEGGRARLGGEDRPLGVRALDATRLELSFAGSAEAWMELMARAEAGVFVLGPGGAVGTGPFAPVRDRPDRLSAFARHRDGRPYLDGVELRPGHHRPEPGPLRMVFELGPEAEPSELLFIARGAGARGIDLARVDAAIDRDALARFLPEGRIAKAREPGGPSPAPAAEIEVALTVPPWLPGDRQLVPRIQYELSQAGIRAVRETPAPDWNRTRRLTLGGRFGLLLGTVHLPSGAKPRDRVNDLLALSARFGRPDLVDAARLESLRADEPTPEALVALEQAVMNDLGLLPLARFGWQARLPTEVNGIHVDGSARLHFENAQRRRADR